MNKIELFANKIIQNYDEQKYWRYKSILFSKRNILFRYYCLFVMKKMEARNNASLGSRVNGGSYFEEKPFFPHGIKGIFIAPTSKIGKNCTIYQQVTIGIKNMDNKQGPIIGNNCFIGAGAKIIGNINIGNNVTIGANAVVFTDIPDNCTVVVPRPRIIKKEQKNEYTK